MTHITTFDAACICIALAALVLGLGVLLGEWRCEGCTETHRREVTCE